MRKQSEKYCYISNLYALEDDLLKRIRESAPKNKEHIQVSAYEGSILKFLMSLIQARHVIEIGTFVGYSSVWIQRGLSGLALVYSVERNPEHYSIALKNIKEAKLDSNIIIHNKNANTFLQEFHSEHEIDAIFIDGQKSEYCSYLDHATRILRKGGMIIADNTLLFDMVYQTSSFDKDESEMLRAMREFNSRLSDASRFQSIMIATDAGLSVAIKK